MPTYPGSGPLQVWSGTDWLDAVDHTHDGEYQAVSQKGQSNGYASLDSSGDVPITQIPTGSTSTTVSAGNHSHSGYASTSTNMTAGNGLTGGGTLASSRTFNVGAGTGISVAADTVSLDTTYTDGRYINTAGDTMSGSLSALLAPTEDGHLTRKDYVDSLVASAGRTRQVILISTNTTLAAAANTDYIYVCTQPLTITLPTAVGNTNMYSVKRTGPGLVSATTTASQTIDGQPSFLIFRRFQSVDFISDGTNWLVV